MPGPQVCTTPFNPFSENCLLGAGGPVHRNFGSEGAFIKSFEPGGLNDVFGAKGPVATLASMNLFAEGGIFGQRGYMQRALSAFATEAIDLITVNPPISAVLLLLLWRLMKK